MGHKIGQLNIPKSSIHATVFVPGSASQIIVFWILSHVHIYIYIICIYMYIHIYIYCESTHFASICPGLFQASLRAVPTPQDFWAQDAHLGAEVGGFNILEAIRLGLQWPWTAGSSSGDCLVQEVQKGFCEAAVSLVVSGRDYYLVFQVWVISHLHW